MAQPRDQWGSRLGFVLAASGSAVGLGNLWKFPYIAWNNHGGAFVLIYLACILAVGMPVMMSEIIIGRRAQTSPVPAFGVLGHPRWAFVGWLGVASGIVILAFYAVIAGWSISSFLQCMKWSFTGYETPDPNAFGDFLGQGTLQVFLTGIFLTVTSFIVSRGISRGIEKATKILMPVLLSIMVLLVLNSFSLAGFGQALGFLFKPDFSEVTGHSVLEALGHAFFTLSLGMGAMITYGSYMKKSESITKASAAIVVLDTVIALAACIIMYSIIFTVPELQNNVGKSTVGMLFVTLPEMFYTKMSLGVVLGPVFYVLVAFAALSSTISLLEVVVSLLVDKIKWSRNKSTAVSALGIMSLSVFCALSNGAWSWASTFEFFGHGEKGIGRLFNNRLFADKQGFLNLFDHFSANWMLPVGGLFITLYAGWILKRPESLEELALTREDGTVHWFYSTWLFFVRFVAPLGIGWIILKVIMGADFS